MAVTPLSAPFPAEDPIADLQRGGVTTPPWVDWFTSQQQRSDATLLRLGAATVTDQSAAIPTTPLDVGSLTSGLYRVSWYLRVTQAATVSSSATITLGWSESGVTLSSAGAAVTGNTTTTVQSGSVLVRVDAASPLTYAVAYASVGATPMKFRLDVTVELVGA